MRPRTPDNKIGQDGDEEEDADHDGAQYLICAMGNYRAVRFLK